MHVDPFPYLEPFGLFNGRWGGRESFIPLEGKCCERKASLAVIGWLRARGWLVVEKLCVAEPTVGWGVFPKNFVAISGIKITFNCEITSKKYCHYR